MKQRQTLEECLQHFDRWITLAKLRSLPYQREGVKWMLKKELGYDGVPLYNQFVLPFDNKIQRDDDRFHCAIMADDMGLGKTIQFMGLVLSNFQKKTLIVLPNALLQQWNTELYRLLGHKAYVYHGRENTFSKKVFEREDDETHYRNVVERVKRASIVLTTYGTLTRAYTTPYNILGCISWSRVIFDEAHYLRSPYSKVSMSAKTLNAEFKWMITGTPIQNHMKDLLSLLEVGGYEIAVPSDIQGIQGILSHFMLRRTKEGVGIELPPVRFHKVIVPWTDPHEEQLSLSFHHIELMRRFDMDQQQEDEDGKERKDGDEENKPDLECYSHFVDEVASNMIGRFIRMKQMCLLPKSMDKKIESYLKQHTSLGLTKSNVLLSGIQSQSKVDAIIRTLNERRGNGRPKIVFAYFRQEMDMLKTRIQEELGLTCAVIDGRTTKTARDEILDTTYDVLLLQIKTCCEGLNLQQYKEIYFTGIDWNPSAEQQAIARAHRIGQEDPVDIFYFIMNKMGEKEEYITLDMYCEEVQERKKNLIREVVVSNA